MKNELAKRAKEYRLARGMSQVVFALYLQISVATVKRLERGNQVSDLVKFKIEKAIQ